MSATIKNKAWEMLWIATGIFFMTGILYTWSVISKSLIKEYHWTNTEASLPYTVATVTFVISMAVFGRLNDTKGPRICVLLSGVLMGLGLMLSGFVTTPVMMVVSFGVIAGAGIGLPNISVTPAVLKWFAPEKKGMVTGIAVAGVALSSAIFALVVNFLIPVVGISKSFIIIGLSVFILMSILALFIKDPPTGYIPEQATASKQKTNPTIIQNDITRKEMLKKASFYGLWIMFAFSSSAGLMVIGQAANIAKVQVHWEGGYLLVILLALFNAAGRIAGGVISDKIGRINLMRIIFVLQAVNMLLFARYLSIPLLIMGAAIAGLCYGAGFSVFPATTADYFGVKNYGANYGIVFTAWGVGGVIGPMMAARIVDSTNSFNTSYFIAFVLLAIAAVITLLFRNPAKNSQPKLN